MSRAGTKSREFTAEEINNIKSLHASGISFTRISKQTGLSYFLVKRILKQETEKLRDLPREVLACKKAGTPNAEICQELSISNEQLKKITRELWNSIN